jgi:uncharacterized protein (DUF3820 family)
MKKVVTGAMKMMFGRYKGQKVSDIPAEYLIQLYESGKTYGDLYEYLEARIDSLREEVSNKNK